MIHRFARVLLVVALVSAGGTAPFAHVHPHGHDHPAPPPEGTRADSQSAHHHGQDAHWHLTGRNAADSARTSTVVGARHHHAAVAVATVAVERPSVRGGATPALVEVWEHAVVPDPAGRPVEVAAAARPDPPPRVVLAARAPPV